MLKSKKVHFEKCRDGSVQYYNIPMNEITKYLDEKSNRGKLSKTQIELVRSYYTIKMKDYPDVITSIDIQVVTGYSKEIIRKWIKSDKIIGCVSSKKFRIAKDETKNERLYYERKSGQYRNEPVQKCRIVSIRSQIKNASAMFNERPHDAAGHYSVLMKDIGEKLFKNDDKPSLYYTSSLALFRFENLIKAKLIDRKYSKGKYHAIMLLKYMFGDVPKYHNAKKVDTFCSKIQKVLNDSDKCFEYFSRIVNYINSQNDLDIEDRKLFERKETTAILLANIESLKDNK